MARKSLADQKKAKEAKQKKILIGLLPLLLLLVVLQGPKLMHHSAGNVGLAPPPVVATDPNAVAIAGAPSVTAAPSVGGVVTDPAAAPVAPSASSSGLADTDVRPVAGSGQLVAFDLFASKDPFIQQVKSIPDGTAPGATATAGATLPSTAGPTGSGPFAGGGSLPSLPTGGGLSTGGGSSSAGGSASAPGSPATPTEPMTTVAGIAINGVLEQVQKTNDFPVAAPVFHLVSFTAAVAKVAVVGGSYQNGSPTLSLPKGKTVTLLNTADGTRYALLYHGSAKVATSSLPATPPATTTTTDPAATTATTPAATPTSPAPTGIPTAPGITG